MKQIRIARFSLAFVVAVTAGTCSNAEDSVTDADAVFQRLDKNGDGKVAASEIPEEQSRYFERLLRRAGKDANGELTRDEFRQASKPDDRPNANFGGPDPARARTDARERFETLDRNKDGKLTLEEVPEQFRDRLKPMFERSGKQELTIDEFTRMAATPPDPAEMFARMDANSDGKLTVDEAPERARPLIAAALRQAGKERTDSLSKDEFVRNFPGPNGRNVDGARRPEGDRASMERNADAPRDTARATERRSDGMAPEGRGPILFRLLDSNRDGHVSPEEFAKLAGLFEQLDQNHDGQLDPQELIGPPPEGTGRRGGPQPAGARRDPDDSNRDAATRRQQAERNPGAIFQRLDRDGDGKISKDEAPDVVKDKFSAIDTNGDGFVTREEFRAGAGLLGDGARSRNPERNRPE